MFIESIDNPNDLKKLTIEECMSLASEIRSLLIKKASENGGHLASNLGIVEATIALHYVFDSPRDKIVFDVSHQCYTHKIITGRKDAFLNVEKYKSVSGYTNPDESIHDNFKVGHTATSISLACGLAKARDLYKDSENIIALIGDGSLSGGEALEGLNYGGSELDSNLIIVFNDNEMSIAENHGGLYKNLRDLRNSNGEAPNNLFKAFGYDYIFVKDGNDVESLINVFRDVKDIDHPIVIHICTTKGKGYLFAEENKENCHWVRPFNIETGEEKNQFSGERYDRIIRDYLINKMKNDSKVTTIIAAVPDALSFTEDKRKIVGKQFIDVGIAEEHAISMAAGIAKNGGKPVFVTMSTFYQRTYDQISQELCINKCAATLIVVNASVYAVNDVTHIGIFDIPIISNIPNMVYLAPTNKQEYLAMLDWSIEQNEHPVAVRAPRNGIFYANGEVDTDYSDLNKYKIVNQGKDVAIIALGDFFQMGEAVVELLYKKCKISATLINPRYITGVDDKMLTLLAQSHSIVVTLEDGILNGGFGEKIASFYGPFKSTNVINYGLKKEFLDRYDLNEVLEKNRLVPEMILEDIKKIL
ncbi:1-deoxy-D-xylulose-5-phosphate synthase [Clostridium butyricum]|uniref:1-deoxy-D-xylulose-5-phosphate synthase n=1 Tax=Clostridium butyricum TaxID=1492 RepID=UPI00374EE056